MTNKTVPDLKELFRQAAEIAEQVPEIMREAAFNRALDMLSGETAGESPANSPRIPIGKKSRGTPKTSSPAVDQNEDVSYLLAAIDSTQHPGIASASKVLDRALMVLQIALRDHEVDGLSATNISSILTGKFRVSTTAPAVRMALDRATNLVNRIPDGKGYLYRIMGPGEAYLAHGNKGGATPSASGKKANRGKAKASKADTLAKATAVNSEDSPKRDARRNRGKSALGPKAAISQLIDAGYLDVGRMASELQEHLQKKKGHLVGADQLRLALLRLVREGALERDTNAEGQYEYKKN